MATSLVSLYWLCMIAGIQGLELSLDLTPKTSDGIREMCGILTCKESIREASPNHTEETISGMSIYKNVEFGSSRSDKKKQGILVASVTLKQPFLSRSSDGVKIDGWLWAGRASIRMELTTEKDCEAQYTCVAKKLDSQQKESINSCQVLQRQVQNSSQEHDESKATSEGGSLPIPLLLQQLDTKLALLYSKVGSVENTLENEISSLYEDIENKMESHIADKDVDDIFNTISELKSDFDKNLVTLTMRVDSIHNKFSYTNAIVINSLSSINDQLRPKACRKGMTPALSLGSFPHPVIVPNTESTLSFPYLCDMITDGGGWIIIQRRTTGNVDFYRDWATYKKGFGSLDDDFWLGNDNIHTITSSGTYELRVDLKYQGRSAFAHYSNFSIDGEDNNYALRLGDYDGTAGDSFDHHRGRPFTTFDKDNDAHRSNCAKDNRGAWWYFHCHNSNLNGKWMAPDDKGPRWRKLSGRNPVSYSEMKVRMV